jgi:sortase (surface protein transpeptidase)
MKSKQKQKVFYVVIVILMLVVNTGCTKSDNAQIDHNITSSSSSYNNAKKERVTDVTTTKKEDEGTDGQVPPTENKQEEQIKDTTPQESHPPENSQVQTQPSHESKINTNTQPIEKTTIPVTQTKEQVTQTAKTMYISNQAIHYENGGQNSGQAIINSDPNHLVSTWGGNPVQSSTDNQNTHFIGHNVGVFTCLLGVKLGDMVTITDEDNQVANYIVDDIHLTDTQGYDVDTKEDLWARITEPGTTERITLQTCYGDAYRLIIFASKV